MQMKNYFLGFDIGTNSIGWATTDEEYNLLKARGQDFWGVYLFDEAQTAEGRRLNRTARRRVARRRQRIKLLQELFAEEIAKKDFCFFERLNNSKYTLEDKVEGVRYKDSLFHDEMFKDSDYHEKYPTIYHLRRAFLQEEEAQNIKDIRLLYLAVAHIVKNRGHFLFEGQSIKAGDRGLAKDALFKMNEILQNINEDAPQFDLRELETALNVLQENKTKTDKERELKKHFAIATSNKTCAALIKAMVGGKVAVKNLFDQDEPSIKDFCFDDATFELEKLKEHFSEDEYALICEAKSVYDWAVLSQILGNHQYISEAMCAKYDAHREDLQLLKDYVLENFGKAKYKEVFSYRENLTNYAAYVGSDWKKRFKHCTKEDFYAYLKKFVDKNSEIYAKIDAGTFLEKQRTSANGVIPYQVHLAELRAILQNASKNFPFLDEVQDGYSVKEKIEMLMTFRVPYYVGPLNDAHSKDGKGFAWVKKFPNMQNEKVTPWNFDKIIDKEASEDEFINRMTNKCKYLVGEDVLPKQSLLYSEFAFLNELNNVTYKGKRLDKQARDAIVAYAKDNSGKLTLKRIGSILEGKGLIEKGEGVKENFAGVDGEIKGSFATYRFFKRVFGENLNIDMCEDIVKCFTIMGDNKRASERIAKKYKLDNDTEKKLRDLNCSGWGTLSRTLLDSEEICHISRSTGEVYTIIQAMRETDCNFMELLSSKYDFHTSIDNFNASNAVSGNVNYATVDALYCSPSVKRAIWRTVCLAREVEKVQGCAPKRIFIEMARGEESQKKGQRTKSRKEQLLELYKSIEGDVRDWLGEIESTEDARFLSDKLYLYYMQMGRSAYSGKPINIEDVFNTNICDIDHIYPQSKLKDDSIINNRVLCYKTENMAKTDVYPLSYEIREKMHPMWSLWHSKKLISDEKYKRLTRSEPLTQDELDDFINRQIVSTRQSTKAVAQVLKQMYPDCDIVYSKAGNVAEFKQNAKIVKVRELNDLHHAKDAYLNIVVGNVYYTKFNRYYKTTAKEHVSTNDEGESYNINKLFYERIYGAWHPSMKSKVVAVANKNTPKVVRFTSSGHGALFNATIEPHGKAGNKYIPLKKDVALVNTYKYGGYNNASISHFALVKSFDKNGNAVLTLEAIPIYVTILSDEEAMSKYLTNNAELICPKILLDKIKINSLLKFNGAYYWLRSKSNNQIGVCNANQLVLDNENASYLKKIVSFFEKQKKLNRKELGPNEEFDKISKDKNVALYNALLSKLASAPYCYMPAIPKQVEFLRGKQSLYATLDVLTQLKLLMEILHLLQCNSTTANLSILGGGSQLGNLLRTKKISQDEEALLITQSPTGYYKETVDLTAYYNL